MKTELEVRILEIDVKNIQSKLEELNAEFIGAFHQRRYVYDFNPLVAGKWIRLRTNGKKATLAIKEVQSNKIDGTKELETIVSDFDATHLILKELGYTERAYQENKRISYRFNECEIEIDSWPLIPTYLEIEGPFEAKIQEVITLLGIDNSLVSSMDVERVYNEVYGIDVNQYKYLSFEESF